MIQQFERGQDGTISLAGNPSVSVLARGRPDFPAWEQELGFPTFAEEWEALAVYTGLSTEHVEFIALDESASAILGDQPFHVDQVICPTYCALEFSHNGLIVGLVGTFQRHAAGTIPGTVGPCITAQARLFNSPLAQKARAGIERGIFTHVCPIAWTPPGGALGTGTLVELTLTTADAAGCKNARILRHWTR